MGFRLLHGLPQATVAQHYELLGLVERHQLYGVGIEHVDAQLLAAAKLTPETRLWTTDERLSAVVDRLGMGFQPTI